MASRIVTKSGKIGNPDPRCSVLLLVLTELARALPACVATDVCLAGANPCGVD